MILMGKISEPGSKSSVDINLGDPDREGRHHAESMMVLYQPWKFLAKEKESLSLAEVDFVSHPLIKIEFTVGHKPRVPERGRVRGEAGSRRAKEDGS